MVRDGGEGSESPGTGEKNDVMGMKSKTSKVELYQGLEGPTQCKGQVTRVSWW